MAIHCPEEWMANELLEYADSKEYKWNAKYRYTDRNYWRFEKQNTIYFIERGTYSSINYVIKNKYKILHYNDVVIKEENNNDKIQRYNI